jgi:hypothetical protein
MKLPASGRNIAIACRSKAGLLACLAERKLGRVAETHRTAGDRVACETGSRPASLEAAWWIGCVVVNELPCTARDFVADEGTADLRSARGARICPTLIRYRRVDTGGLR